MIVPLVVVLAIADDVHIMQHYGEARRAASRPSTRSSRRSRTWSAPLFGASGTTALGMASLATSSIVAVREFGLGSAVGVMVDFVISIVLMPTMLGWLKPEDEPGAAGSVVRRAAAMAGVASPRARAGAIIGRGRRVSRLFAMAGLCAAALWTRTTSTSSAEPPAQPSADVIDKQAVRDLHVPGPARGPAGLDEAAGRARAHGPARSASCASCRSSGRSPASPTTSSASIASSAMAGPSPCRATPAVVAQELFVFSLGDEGRVELERDRGERLLEGADHRQARVDELRSRLRADPRGRAAWPREMFAGIGRSGRR